MSKPSVLVVEDDAALAEVLLYNLGQAGYEVALARDGQDGLRQAQLKLPDAIVLDLMLPVIDGLEVCRRPRADPATSGIGVLMLTAKSEESDQVVGFSIGADDYVTKPFSVKVLMERIKSLLRRGRDEVGDTDLVASQGVTIDRRRHMVKVGDQSIDLTQSEFGLLEALVRQPGRAFNQDQLIDVALGEDTIVLQRTIDVHIRSLRKKLGGQSGLIETVRGVGYRFRDPNG